MPPNKSAWNSIKNIIQTNMKGVINMAKRKQIPARTPEAREQQLYNLAVDEAERRLMNGTASSQIIATLLKLATTKAQLELEKLRSDIALQKAKEKEIESKASNNDLYERALAAFRSYRGEEIDEDMYEDDDY